MSKGTGYFRPRSRDEVLSASSQPMPVLASKSTDDPRTSSCDQDRVKPADNHVDVRGNPRSSCSSSSNSSTSSVGVSSACRSTRSTARVSRFAAAGNPPFTTQSMNIGKCAPNKPVQSSSLSVTSSGVGSLTGAFPSGEQTQQGTGSQGGYSSTSTMLFTPVFCVPPPTTYIHSWDEQATTTAVGTRSSSGNSSGSMPVYISTGVPPAVPLTAATSNNPNAASYAAAGAWPVEHGSSLSALGSCAAVQPAVQGEDVSARHWQQDHILVVPEFRGPALQVTPAAQPNTPQVWACQQQDLALLQLQQEYEAASATAAAVLRQAQARLATATGAVQQVQSSPGACSQQLVQCAPGLSSASIVGGGGLASGTTNSAALMACGQVNNTMLQQQQLLQQLQQELQQLQLRQEQRQLQLQQSLLPACVGSGVLPGCAGGSPAQLVTPLAVVTTGWAPGPCLTVPPSLLCSSSSLASASMHPPHGNSTAVAPVPIYSIGGGQCVMGNNVAAVAAAAAVAHNAPAQAQQLVTLQVPLGR